MIVFQEKIIIKQIQRHRKKPEKIYIKMLTVVIIRWCNNRRYFSFDSSVVSFKKIIYYLCTKKALKRWGLGVGRPRTLGKVHLSTSY